MNDLIGTMTGPAAGTDTPTMSSREIAELVGSRHDKVKQSIERLAERGTIALPPLGEYRDGLGRPAAEYRIGKRDSYVIVAQLSPEFTARLVDRWQELEARPPAAPPPANLNDAATLRTLLLGYSEQLLALEERNTALAGENAALAPKADALDRIGATDGSMNITAAAKVLKVGPRTLAEWLRSHGWTYRRPDTDRMLAFQAKIDAGYLEHRLVRFTPPGQPERSAFQVMVTARGITKLAAALAGRAAA